MDQEELQGILDDHMKWLESEGKKGARADLSGRELRRADFRRADLTRASLKGTDLTDAVFHDAVLREADLSDAVGLHEHQLAGADLYNSKLPGSIAEFSGLKHAEEISKQARTIFLMVIGACMFSWLAIATTTDLALILGSSEYALPVLQTKVPIVGFYWAAPAILLGLYAYLHLYLQNLWTTLSRLPAILPDGNPLDQKAYPWLATSLVRAYGPLLRKDRHPYSRLSVWFTIIWAWGLVPVTILLFWARYLPRHDWSCTIWLVALSTVAAWWAIDSFLMARKKLRGKHRQRPERSDRRQRLPLRFVRRGLLPGLAGLVIFSSCSIVSHHGLSGELTHYRLGSLSWAEHLFHQSARLRRDGIDVNLQKTLVQYLAARWLWWRTDSWLRADIIDQKISQPDAKWEDAYSAWFNDPKKAERPKFPGPRLAGMNLRFSRIIDSSLVGAFLEGAELECAMLSRTDLRLAVFWRYFIVRTNLRHAILHEANLQGAILKTADLRGAGLNGADLRRADLTEAVLQDAFLYRANLQGAQLTGANLQGANLMDVNPTTGNESKARKGDTAKYIDFEDANLWGALLYGASLENAKNLSQNQVDEACCDEDTELPPHLTTDTCVENGMTVGGLRFEWSYPMGIAKPTGR